MVVQRIRLERFVTWVMRHMKVLAGIARLMVIITTSSLLSSHLMPVMLWQGQTNQRLSSSCFIWTLVPVSSLQIITGPLYDLVIGHHVKDSI